MEDITIQDPQCRSSTGLGNNNEKKCRGDKARGQGKSLVRDASTACQGYWTQAGCLCERQPTGADVGLDRRVHPHSRDAGDFFLQLPGKKGHHDTCDATLVH
jgi:hypothetical protein